MQTSPLLTQFCTVYIYILSSLSQHENSGEYLPHFSTAHIKKTAKYRTKITINPQLKTHTVALIFHGAAAFVLLGHARAQLISAPALYRLVAARALRVMTSREDSPWRYDDGGTIFRARVDFEM